MFENITKLVNGRQFTETVKQELYVNYVKHKELKLDDNELVLLFNKKKETEIQREANGVIFEKKTNKVVCACYPDFVDIENDEDIGEYINNKMIESIEYCEDGTVIRLYYYNNQWRTATKKCIDARYSSWSSIKSFDNIFWELFNNSEETGKEPSANGIDDVLLDKNRTYIFILLHIENVLVVKHQKNKLIYKGSIDNNTFDIKQNYDSLFKNHKLIEHVENIDLSQYSTSYSTSNNDETIINQSLILTHDNINKLMFNNSKRGIIFKFKQDNNIYKYDFATFKLLNDIRGNEPLIRIRYLELLSEPEKLNLLIKYYPEYNMVFSMIYHNIMVICNDIYMVYRNSHIKHTEKIDDTHKYYRTIKQIHAQYKRTNIPITKDDILEKLKTLNTYVLKNLLGWV